MHLNAKSAQRRLNASFRRRRGPVPLLLNNRYMAEAIARGKDLLNAVPGLTEVVLHVPQLHPTNGWYGSKRRQGERIVVTHATKELHYA